MRSVHILRHALQPHHGPRKHNVVAELVRCTRVIMASAEDMRVLLKRTGGMERALMEQQTRAGQPSAALQGKQAQQQQTAAPAQEAQRRAAAAQTAGIGASVVVDTRLLGKPVALDGRETGWRSFKFQIVACCGAIDSRLKDLVGSGRNQRRGSDVQRPRGAAHASSQCSAAQHADPGVPGGCAEAVGARG